MFHYYVDIGLRFPNVCECEVSCSCLVTWPYPELVLMMLLQSAPPLGDAREADKQGGASEALEKETFAVFWGFTFYIIFVSSWNS